ncbi:MAG: hypothetical protein ACTHKZ_08045 [Lysobacteraceae bacterium]
MKQVLHVRLRGLIAKGWWLALACLLAAGCQRAAPQDEAVTLGDRDPARAQTPPRPAPPPADYLATTQWPPARLRGGDAWLSCGYDYAGDGDGRRLQSLEFFAMVDALDPCRAAGTLRLRYHGKIDAGFTALVERVGAIADRMDIRERILDLDSAGGQVEEAIRAGDAIAGGRWAIWVREDSICHSACVLVLAAGDTRSIAGKVGIHRLIRDRSQATTRAELSAELKDVTQQVREYLARNGVAVALADEMMTIPNRKLRLLTAEEMDGYGLSGTNAVQDDLDRITLARRCGEDTVHRRDAFMRAFDAQCMAPGEAFGAMEECGRGLEQRYGFPDPQCPGQSPMDDYARRMGTALPVVAGAAAAPAPAEASTPGAPGGSGGRPAAH